MPRRPQSSVSAELSLVAGGRCDGCAAKDPLVRPLGGRFRDCAAKRTVLGVRKMFAACLSIVKAITNRASKYQVDWWGNQPQIRCGP